MRISTRTIHCAVAVSVCLALLFGQGARGQQKSITGKVTDQSGQPLAGVTVSVKGTASQTSTNQNGNYQINAESGKILTFMMLGLTTEERTVGTEAMINVVLQESSNDLDEVVVVGYGTQRKSDLTGAVASVSSKDFNKGPLVAADQLIQGKVSGVQMINNSGAPGGASTVRIRGNSAVTGSGQPLYIVDGVALDGRSARPSQNGGLGSTNPAGNPLSFINPSDIASMEILKDASATAIYGARAAYGVVLITTKRGQAGEFRLDANASAGVSSLFRKIDIADGNQYRDALTKYGITSGDYGGNVDAMDAILRTAHTQNYGVSFSGGNENNTYRGSFGYQDQQGIIRKTGFKRYSASFNGNFKMLDSKKLGLDVFLITSHNNENIGPIANDAGAEGSLITHALAWNPTRPLRNDDGSLTIEQGNIINPLAMSEAYDDRANVSTIMGSLSPYYKFNDWLTYRFLVSVNYSRGERRASTRSYINIGGILADPANDFLGGFAGVANNELITTQLTHTLNFNKEIATDLNLNAVVGYEYMDYKNRGNTMTARGFGEIPVDYTDVMQATAPANRVLSSFNDPTTQLQSYFGRVNFNYLDRYLLTATVRADGSTRFGENHKYGTFPSFALAWNLKNESFLSDAAWLDQLKLRAGWGKTGNQEFPSGSSQRRYGYSYEGGAQQIIAVNNENPDLKWQADEQINVGVDFGLWGSRLTGTVDYFHKKTSDLLFPQIPFYPAAADQSVTWVNLPGEVINKGVELTLNGVLVENENFSWDLGGNATFVSNNTQNMGNNIIRTGSLNGQGLSDVTVEVIQNGYPLFAMVTRQYQGLDEEGFSKYADDGYVFYKVGNPNPSVILGLNTNLRYKNFSFNASFNGALGQDIYNNTANAVLPISNLGTRNVAAGLLNSSIMESPANPIAASSRYIENGSYVKLANATLSYQVGNVGKSLKNLNVFVNGQNLFVITDYMGFDPEVNVDKSVGGVPSAGIDNVSYPPARTFNLGVNFSL